jgi:transcriptional regulator with XRE-family HTH domain
VGQLLQAARRRAKLSQAELAANAGLAANHVARLERGEKAYPRFDTVAKLAAQLGVSLDWIAAECGLVTGPRRPPAPALRRVLTALNAGSERNKQTQAELAEAAQELRAALGLGPARRRTRP